MARTHNPWQLYDELIAQIPDTLPVTDWYFGGPWCAVESGDAMGISFKQRVEDWQFDAVSIPSPEKLTLKELATYAKSWNFAEASIGMAAINAYYTTYEKAQELNSVFPADKTEDILNIIIPEFAGQKVGVVGHFPHVEDYAELCDLTVFELNPRSPIDVPASAAEFILPECDLALITGTTLSNKTAPRLLELAQNALTIMVGPSTVLAPQLFEHGVDILASSVVLDKEIMRNKIIDQKKLFGEHFRMANLYKTKELQNRYATVSSTF